MKKLRSFISILLVIAGGIFYYFMEEKPQEEVFTAGSEDFQVHFIDVGQADCIFISSKGEYMLIDAGNNDDSELVVNYLKQQGVEKLKFVVGTHPHEDHIGGTDAVINAFDVETLIMPDKTHTTKTFKDVIEAASRKNLSITLPEVGAKYTLGDANITVLGPGKDYGDELNNWSVGLRIVNGKNSFVFCGDAEKEPEEDMINSGLNLKADVFKLNHHGSTTSNTWEFLEAVDPKYAVICCETGNDYGHPHKEIMERLENLGIEVYRTDTQGTVIVESDGENLNFITEK